MQVFLFLGLVSSIKNSDLFETWVSAQKIAKKAEVVKKLLSFFDISDVSQDIQRDFNNVAHFFCRKMEEKWKKASRKRERFLINYREWLKSEIMK